MLIKNIFYFCIFIFIKSNNDEVAKDLSENIIMQYIKNICPKGIVEVNVTILKDCGVSVYLPVYDEKFCNFSFFYYGVFFNCFKLPLIGGIYASILFHFSTEKKEFGLNIYKLNIDGTKIFLMKKIYDYKFGFVFLFNEQGMSISACFSYNVFCSRCLLISGYVCLSLFKEKNVECLKSFFRNEANESTSESKSSKVDPKAELKLPSEDPKVNFELLFEVDPKVNSELSFEMDSKVNPKLSFEVDPKADSELRSEINPKSSSEVDLVLPIQLNDYNYKINFDGNELELCVIGKYSSFYDINTFSNEMQSMLKQYFKNKDLQAIVSFVEEQGLINVLNGNNNSQKLFVNGSESESCDQTDEISDSSSNTYSDINSMTFNKNIVRYTLSSNARIYC